MKHLDFSGIYRQDVWGHTGGTPSNLMYALKTTKLYVRVDAFAPHYRTNYVALWMFHQLAIPNGQKLILGKMLEEEEDSRGEEGRIKLQGFHTYMKTWKLTQVLNVSTSKYLGKLFTSSRPTKATNIYKLRNSKL